MTGSNYNKGKGSSPQSGQILLVIVMLLATALTIVLAVSFRSTTETQVTKLEEDNQRALAAAESAIDKALQSKQGTVLIGNGKDVNLQDFSGSASFDTTTTTSFTTPLLQKDEEYTFYTSTPGGSPPGNPDFTTLTASYPNNLTVCFGSQNLPPALELTVVKGSKASGYDLVRYAVNPVDSGGTPVTIIQNAPSASSATNCPAEYTSEYTLSVPADGILVIARVITNDSTSTKITFKGPTNLPPQGKTIVSSATANSGASKTVQLFQSYPQIPSEFFVTAF